MLVAMIAAFPAGIRQAALAFTSPLLCGAAAGVGITSSLIPYACDQLAKARLPRASFALLLALLPATATVVGLVVLGQNPSPSELLGVMLVMAAVSVPSGGTAARRSRWASRCVGR
jgi:inner membrane transporter RhtA